jgi:hypothetical protein
MSAFILLPFISVVLVHLTPFISTHNQTIAGQTHLISSTQKEKYQSKKKMKILSPHYFHRQ